MNKLAGFAQLKALQQTLHSHKIYDAVNHQSKIKIFMEAHVFAVWDFMLLLKGLQRSLTCVNRIWLPPASRSTARFINEIVLGEQTDQHPDGHSHASHFELYIEAMKEVNADISVIQNYISTLRKGATVHDALNQAKVPAYVKEFVTNTVSSLDKPTPYIASQFFYGRQDPIPQMFQRFVDTLPKDKSCEFLKFYLKRHVQVDGEQHGPLAQQLMNELAARQDPNFQIILSGAINAVQYRIKLWDGIYNVIK